MYSSLYGIEIGSVGNLIFCCVCYVWPLPRVDMRCMGFLLARWVREKPAFVEISYVSIAERLSTRLLLRNSSRVDSLSAIET